jgi:mannose-6-phosphate isomerase-like protein (cupin superfamily)
MAQEAAADRIERRVTVMHFATKTLPPARDTVAPDGSEVRFLLGLAGGGMAHFELGPNQVSRAVTHRSVEEIWFCLSGRGQMWRRQGGQATIVDVYAGVCLTLPLGTHFQFRSFGDEPLAAIAITMPPWPGNDEAIVIEGAWPSTVP